VHDKTWLKFSKDDWKNLTAVKPKFGFRLEENWLLNKNQLRAWLKGAHARRLIPFRLRWIEERLHLKFRENEGEMASPSG